MMGSVVLEKPVEKACPAWLATLGRHVGYGQGVSPVLDGIPESKEHVGSALA